MGDMEQISAETASVKGNDSDSEDDAAPDYTELAGLAARAAALQQEGHGEDGTTLKTPFIPKRGEKDFEPTGFSGQNKALEKSRKAMFDVIKFDRSINSKSISVATWEPFLNRAVVQLYRGQTFMSMGHTRKVTILEDGQYEDLARHYNPTDSLPRAAGVVKEGRFWPKTQSRLELYPEEALFLIERGSLECRIQLNTQSGTSPVPSMKDYDDHSEPQWVSLSVEEAYATMLFADGLTRERYQVCFDKIML